MTRALPPMASFAEIVTTTVRAATYHLAEGSRRNARDAALLLEGSRRVGRGSGPAQAGVPCRASIA